MTLSGLKVVVIGAGIGGLAAARTLAMRGADVTVLEQADAIREVGAGLQISPNGFRVMDALGLGRRLEAISVRGSAVRLRDYRGGEVIRLDLGLLDSDHYHFVHRADLIELLATGARAAGVRIRFLQRVDHVAPGAPPTIKLTNGAVMTADLVIGADGLHSVVRTALNGAGTPFFTGQVAWRAVIPAYTSRQDGEVQVYMGPHRHVVTYPLRGGQELNLVAVQERAAWTPESWSQRDDPVALRAAFGDFSKEIQELLARVDSVNLWGLFRHPVASRWHDEGLAILGDAAHPTLPFMAQGACMALEDAWIVADSLERETELGRALSVYQGRREHRARKIVATANKNGWRYHVAFRPLRGVLHTGMRLAGMMAPRQVLKQFRWIYDYDAVKN
ncbi:FAD-dependent monooxygenase [Roseovarius sp. SYSU LYC5161]|uniref:FAD-dependent monooxygenase n=1 Tax=Roseovarius halophilus (ex Wu et al. 2025) TaxID=3376060 RepID=UPI00399B16B3